MSCVIPRISIDPLKQFSVLCKSTARETMAATDVGRTVITVQTVPYSHISLPTFFTRIAIMKRQMHSRTPTSVKNI